MAIRVPRMSWLYGNESQLGESVIDVILAVGGSNPLCLYDVYGGTPKS